jgi:predicted dehydrogenase
LNAFNPALKNGALMDIGVYCVHVLTLLFGKPESIQAQSMLLSNGLDSAGAVTAVYPDLLGQLSYSKISDSCSWSELQGECGTLLIDDICNPKLLTLRPRGKEPIDITVPVSDFGMGAEIDAFLRMIEVGGEELLQQNTVLHSIYWMRSERKQALRSATYRLVWCSLISIKLFRPARYTQAGHFIL